MPQSVKWTYNTPTEADGNRRLCELYSTQCTLGGEATGHGLAESSSWEEAEVPAGPEALLWGCGVAPGLVVQLLRLPQRILAGESSLGSLEAACREEGWPGGGPLCNAHPIPTTWVSHLPGRSPDVD